MRSNRLAALAFAALGAAVGACGSSSSSTPTPDFSAACTTYCSTVATNCTAANLQYTPLIGPCQDYCVRALSNNPEIWSAGAAAATSGNSLACRTTHAGLAATDPVVHCPHAGTSGGNTCGDWCENYCDLALSACTGSNQLYATKAACLTACALIPSGGVANATSGNTLQCRIYHLAVASTPANALVHCPHGNAVPTGPCQ